mgnify:CR=1 FL=1|jgi:hypothetical protein
MQIKDVIKNLKTETKQLTVEAKESLNYLKDPKIPYQLEWVNDEIKAAESEYNKFLDITQEGDKQLLKDRINHAYRHLVGAYENLRYHYAVWSFLREIKGDEILYIDEKKEFFKQKVEELKKIKY